MAPVRIFQYHRNRKTKAPIGLVVAEYDPKTNKFRFGHSLCAVSRNDVFDRERARNIALGRLESCNSLLHMNLNTQYNEVSNSSSTQSTRVPVCTVDGLAFSYGQVPHSMRDTVSRVISRIAKIKDSLEYPSPKRSRKKKVSRKKKMQKI